MKLPIWLVNKRKLALDKLVWQQLNCYTTPPIYYTHYTTYIKSHSIYYYIFFIYSYVHSFISFIFACFTIVMQVVHTAASCCSTRHSLIIIIIHTRILFNVLIPNVTHLFLFLALQQKRRFLFLSSPFWISLDTVHKFIQKKNLKSLSLFFFCFALFNYF